MKDEDAFNRFCFSMPFNGLVTLVLMTEAWVKYWSMLEALQRVAMKAVLK